MNSSNPLYRILGTSFWIEWLFAFVLVVLARLPYLLSDHVYFDGDEAMLGIMGRDLITGQNIPFYFYGQQYGFSFFEALSAGFFILFLGSTVWSLKFGGMLLFSLGIQRLLKVLRVNQVSTLTFLLTAFILVAFPTWVVWGTKLRGGYITAFVTTAFITELLFNRDSWARNTWIMVGVLSAITAVAQPFFILPIAFLMLKKAFESQKSDLLIGIISGTISLVILRALAYLNPDYWNTPMDTHFNLDSLTRYFGENFLSNFTGFFAFTDYYEVPQPVILGAVVFLATLAIWVVYQLIVSKSSSKQAIALLLLGTLSTVLVLPFFPLEGGRYQLPFFTGILLLILALAISKSSSLKHIQNGLLIVCLGSLIPTLAHFDKYVSYWLEREEPDMKRLTELMEVLEERDLRYGFVSEWQLIWQLNYLGNDEMAFRYQTIDERVPRFVENANACYLDPNCKTVLTGGVWPLHDMQTVPGWNDSIEKINARYYVMENPDTIFLNKGRFELPEGN